jgi:uncharacterized protein YutE (UPF0331/DUF86 family)
MLHERLLEIIASHVKLLDEARRRVDWSDTLSFYGILYALQVHAQAIIDYLLHTCAILGVSAETPFRCTEELQRASILAPEEALMLRRLIRFRNIVVHEYGSIDVNRVKQIVERRGYREALKVILKVHGRLRERGLLDP